MPPPARRSFLLTRTRAAVARNGSRVRLHWQERTGPVTTDPVSGAVSGGTLVPKIRDVRGLLHWPDFNNNQVRQFAEIQAGDLIVDFPADVPLDGKVGLRFEVDSKFYTAKGVSERLGRSWNVMVGDVKLLRPVLLQRAPA